VGCGVGAAQAGLECTSNKGKGRHFFCVTILTNKSRRAFAEVRNKKQLLTSFAFFVLFYFPLVFTPPFWAFHTNNKGSSKTR
jgi:hypothetical protein